MSWQPQKKTEKKRAEYKYMRNAFAALLISICNQIERWKMTLDGHKTTPDRVTQMIIKLDGWLAVYQQYRIDICEIMEVLMEMAAHRCRC